MHAEPVGRCRDGDSSRDLAGVVVDGSRDTTDTGLVLDVVDGIAALSDEGEVPFQLGTVGDGVLGALSQIHTVQEVSALVRCSEGQQRLTDPCAVEWVAITDVGAGAHCLGTLRRDHVEHLASVENSHEARLLGQLPQPLEQVLALLGRVEGVDELLPPGGHAGSKDVGAVAVGAQHVQVAQHVYQSDDRAAGQSAERHELLLPWRPTAPGHAVDEGNPLDQGLRRAGNGPDVQNRIGHVAQCDPHVVEIQGSNKKISTPERPGGRVRRPRRRADDVFLGVPNGQCWPHLRWSGPVLSESGSAVRFLQLTERGVEVPVAQVEDGQGGVVTYDLSSLTDQISGDFLASGGLARAAEAVRGGRLPEVDVAGRRVGAPIARPGAVLCIGMNYAAHAAESGAQPPAQPVLFLKTPNTVAGPNDAVRIPARSRKTDWEVELAVVTGRAELSIPGW